MKGSCENHKVHMALFYGMGYCLMGTGGTREAVIYKWTKISVRGYHNFSSYICATRTGGTGGQCMIQDTKLANDADTHGTTHTNENKKISYKIVQAGNDFWKHMGTLNPRRCNAHGST